MLYYLAAFVLLAIAAYAYAVLTARKDPYEESDTAEEATQDPERAAPDPPSSIARIAASA